MKNALLFLLVFITTFAFAQNNSGFEINLKSETFTPEVTTDFEAVLKPLLSESVQGQVYRLIQFYDIPTNAQKLEITAAGIELMSYIPNKAFVAKFNKNISNSDFTGLNIRSISEIKASYKLSPLLTKSKYPDWAMSGKDIKLNLKYYSKSDEAILLDFISTNEGVVLEKPENTSILIVQYPTVGLQGLAAHPMVQWLEPISPPSTPDDTGSKNTSRSNTLNTQYQGGRKYDGTGVMVGLADDGAVGPHIDFTGRMTINTLEDAGKHGDMCSGILAGAGNLDPSIGGMCPGVGIQIYRIGTFIFLSSQTHILNAVDQYNNIGQVITSTSYSQGIGGVYNASTEFIDQQLNENPNIMHVFAAGNSGTQDHGYGAGTGWGTISGGMKAGKNLICSGNLNASDDLFFSSSRGPAADGRIKPDLCAQGEGLLTTDQNNTFQPGNGTSAACPAIAGVMTQLYQAYREHNGGVDPETGLLKAALLNTANDLGNPGPDYKHGWGGMNALKAVRIIEDNRYIKESIAQGESKSHTVTIPDNVSQVRIMTYWADVSGNSAAAKALVNDINMQVVTPNATTYNPLVLDPTPDATLLDAPAVQGIDNLNNVEQVRIDNPAAGDYTVNLDGFAIPQGPQTYFVLYEFIYDDVELTFPIGGEGLVPGETVQVKWDASESSDFFSFQYSDDGGTSYNNLGTISSSERSYSWSIPNIISDQVKFKINRGTTSSESHSNFTIAEVPQNVEILSVCPDGIEIGWDAVNGVSEYEISMLGEKYMDSIGVSATNTFSIAGLNPNETHWFSVRSLVSASKGRRAIAINQPGGTENCNLNNDIKLTQVISPQEGVLTTCRDLANTEITIKLNNIGMLTASNVDLNYQINSGPIITETVSGDILSGVEQDFTFATPSDLSGLSNFEFSVWASFPSDENFFNDTLRSNIDIYNTTVISSYPSYEFCQSFLPCSTAFTCELIECFLGNGWINYTNRKSDDIDWRTDAGGTGTGSTGPSTDYDDGTENGKYLYIEGTQGCNLKEAILFSPCIDLSTAQCANLEFAYHMYGVNIGELHVDVVTETGTVEDAVAPIIGEQGNQWSLLNVDLTPFIGSIINVKIRGSIGNGTRADIAIDAMTFNVFDAADANFDYQNGGIGNPTFFTNTSIGSTTAYMWDFGDGNTSTEQSPSHEYASAGTYQVTLTINGDCGSDTITLEVIITTTSTFDLQDLASGIEIYPNPNDGKFTIDFPRQLTNKKTRVELYDVLGHRILNNENNSTSGKLSIDASGTTNGVYFIKISSEDFEVVRRLIKH